MINKNHRVQKVYNYIADNAMIIFLLWSLWLTMECLFLGRFSYVRIFDVGDQILPMRLTLIPEFFQYGVNYWFPYAACGTDRLSLAFLNFFQVDSLFFLHFLDGLLMDL